MLKRKRKLSIYFVIGSSLKAYWCFVKQKNQMYTQVFKKEIVEEYIKREKKGDGLTYKQKLEKEKYFFNTFLIMLMIMMREKTIYLIIYILKGTQKKNL